MKKFSLVNVDENSGTIRTSSEIPNKKASVSYLSVIADLEARRKNLDNPIAGLKDIVQMGELR